MPPMALDIALHQVLLLLWPEKEVHMDGNRTRALAVQGFSAGSYTGAWILDRVCKQMGELYHVGPSVLAAIAMPPHFMKTAQQIDQVTFLHLQGDPLCCIDALAFRDTFRAFKEAGAKHAKCAVLTAMKKHQEWFGNGHGIAHLLPYAAQLAAFTEVNEACLRYPMTEPTQQLA